MPIRGADRHGASLLFAYESTGAEPYNSLLTRYHTAATMDDIGRAEKKLRQAVFFAHALATLKGSERQREIMEFYLSASLTAAQSAFYVLRAYVGNSFEREHKAWRQTRKEDERAFLNRMIGLRDDDVHEGTIDAATLNQFVDKRPSHGVAIFGSPPDADVEGKNPDGSTVRGPVLSSVPTIYIDHAGNKIEATSACQQFTALLRELVEHFKRGTRPGAAP
jgi:hypothetical protein